jgi:hypothetical protein
MNRESQPVGFEKNPLFNRIGQLLSSVTESLRRQKSTDRFETVFQTALAINQPWAEPERVTSNGRDR